MNSMVADFAITTSEWLVLTCASTATLRLAESLRDDGFEAWTPITRDVKRRGDQRTREEFAVPLMPSFVFAKAKHLHRLLALMHSPAMIYRVWDAEKRKMVAKGHPHFRMPYGARLIPDRQIEPLRRMERLPRPKRVERTFEVGQEVRTDDAGFAGLTGTVTGIRGKMVRVTFGGWFEPEIHSWALRPLDETSAVNVNSSKPECDAA